MIETDKEKLKKLFDEFGIGYTVDNDNFTENSIVCEEGNSKINGYSRFFTIFEFDENNKFVEMGAWE